MPRRKTTNNGKTPKKQPSRKEGHLIPPRVPDEVLQDFTYKGTDEEAQSIVEYVEWQSRKDRDRVTFLEKVQTEYVLGEAHDCWNVQTKQRRWWVITNPTNLYSQELFPSLDYTITFHLGLMLRLSTKRKGTEDDRLGDRLATAFRRWEQAAEALDQSKESEDIQAVGMRCRETLLAFIRQVANPKMVASGQETPQTSNFVGWSALIADTIAPGGSNERVRGYLKAIAKEGWQFVSWLTHGTHATRFDGIMALDATHALLEAYGAALLRYERQAVDRCERCGSLQLIAIYDPEFQRDGAKCLSCGWELEASTDKDVSKTFH